VGWAHSVRVGDWKAVSFFVNESMALYNVTADIGETTDLSQQYPEVVQQLTALAASQHNDSIHFPVSPCIPS
jgi:arylsulfatase A-like enzyme